MNACYFCNLGETKYFITAVEQENSPTKKIQMSDIHKHIEESQVTISELMLPSHTILAVKLRLYFISDGPNCFF